MHISTNDQIGYAPQTHARPYVERAKTQNRLMNTPFDVSENPGTVDNNNRQNLPVQAYKIDGREQGTPNANCNQAYETITIGGGGESLNLTGDSFGQGSGVSAPPSGNLPSDIANYFATVKPGQSVQWGGGTLTMVPDGSGFLYESAGGGRGIEIARNTPMTDWERIKKEGEALAAAATALGQRFAANFDASFLEYAQRMGSIGGWEDPGTGPSITPQMQSAYDAHFANTKPGTVTQFGDGYLVKGMGDATQYCNGKTGETFVFSAKTPISALFQQAPELAAIWDEQYGLGTAIAGTGGGGYGTPTVDYVQAYETITSGGGGESLNVTGDSFGQGSGVSAPPSGNLPSDIANYFATVKPGQSVQWGGGTLTMVPDGSGFLYESAGGGRGIEIARNTPMTDWERIKKEGEALAAAATALGQQFAANFDASFLEYAQYMGVVGGWKAPSQAKAPSSQNYLNTAMAVRLKLADHDVIC